MKKVYLTTVISFIFVTLSSSQNYRIQNGIGIYGGLTSFNINTDNFVIERSSGWLAGLASTVNLPHRWYNVSYNIQLSENKLNLSASPAFSAQQEVVEYKVFAAQVALVGHLKLIRNNLTLDAGPMLQYNSTLDLQDDTKAAYILQGYNTLTADDISEISRFNVNSTVGLSAGFNNFKLRGQYIYGFTNMLGRLNKESLAPNIDFKGNQNMLVFSAMIVF